MGPVPRKWSVRNVPLSSVLLSAFSVLKRASGIEDARGRRQPPVWGFAGDVALVGEFFFGGAVGHGREGNDKARKGRRGQGPRASQ